MTLPVILHRSVQGEIDEAARWYEDQRTGLGREFLEAIDRVMCDITANPARFGFAKADIREGAVHASPMRSTIGYCRIGSEYWPFTIRPATPQSGHRETERHYDGGRATVSH